MGQDIKSLRNRIKSVDSTLHLTQAMGLVASSKIRRATDGMIKARAYMASWGKIISQLTSSPECRKSIFVREGKGDRLRIIVVAGDRGLAGGYNANIFRFMRDYPNAEIIAVGKHACDRYGKKFYSSEHFTSAEAREIALEQCRDFEDGKYDRLLIVSTKYISIMSQIPIVTQLLPLKKSENVSGGVIFEPDELTILNTIVPEYVSGIVTSLIRESFACEVASRKTAMDSAGKNASEMIDKLQLSYNRARQGAITQEITEIVAGSNS